MWVVLEKESFKPLRHSDPFYLHHRGIEYCLGTSLTEGGIVQLFVSVWDRESWIFEMCSKEIKRGLREIY
jgi:hypothetical protein